MTHFPALSNPISADKIERVRARLTDEVDYQFLLGRMTAKSPELARRELAEGHTVGHHSYNHPLLGNMSPEKAMADIDRGFAADDTALYGKSAGKVLRLAGVLHLLKIAAGLLEAVRWLWLARFLRADASFHFIHAADIARVCAHLATTPQRPNPEAGQGKVRRLVLGQPAVTVNQTVRSLVGWRRGWMPPVGLDLSEWLIEGLIKLLRIDVNAWDRFSIRQRHFVHEPISPPERFGMVSHAPTLEAVFEDAGLPR